MDLVEPGRAILECQTLLEIHERAEHQERRVRDGGVALVGAQHPVDQLLAVAAAAGGDQDVGLGGQLVLVRLRRRGRHRAPQIARERDLLRERPHVGELGQRIEDLRQAIDPDLVIEVVQGRIDVLAPPFVEQAARLVHHVAQAQHQPCAPLLQERQGVQDLAAQAQRLLVDQKEVRVEDVGGVLDDGAADVERLLDVDVQLQGRVFAVAQLDHAGHAHEIDAGLEIEAADDRRAREDQDRQMRELLDQMVSDRPTAAQMPQTETVVAEDQQPSGGIHSPLSFLCKRCPGALWQSMPEPTRIPAIAPPHGPGYAAALQWAVEFRVFG